ncbi:Na+/H+ antiporter NhaC family protein [Permianibacter aggregans]|uniref:Transporter (NhaC family) n=1 Tax=Permianibacter aggregans TaxID=1510150 RepID=A0A4R6U547_9GAMM|nr:Na+/H+ antiporter NhaC family protein [Permianibacter aggregans]QGX39980.1 sodium:proton antiporter [Permianibacter aggregans]TDQ41321.1 transporter (NhaC family) [Permianibacter aggregans]
MEWLSLLPPLLAIAIAVWKREVMLALVAAIFSAEWLLNGSPLNAFVLTFERMIAQLADAGNARILLFSLLVGALIAFVRDSGGVSAFIRWIEQRGFANSPRQVGWLAVITGSVLFIESNLSILGACLVSASLFDKHNMSRARLAYFADATCAPTKVLVLLNGWGAYALTLISGYGLENPVSTLAWSVPLNFYCLTTLLIVFWTVHTGKVFGPMKVSESRAAAIDQALPAATSKRYFLAPIAVMIVGIITLMYITGDGNIMKGSGSKSVLWATALAVLTGYVLLRAGKRFRHRELVQVAFKGMNELLPLVALVLLAMALGDSLKALGTGTFIASIVGAHLPALIITPLVFLAACLMSFATGTSWGTFAIMMPIAMPLSLSTGIPPSMLVSAVLGGGVFGDHCSGISDSTILSSLASGCDHYEHIKTQLPYAVTAALVTITLYIVVGLFLGL